MMPTQNIYYKTNLILKIEDILKLQEHIFYHKYIKNKHPEYFKSPSQSNTSAHYIAG